MRILVVADLHYSLPQYDWLLAEAPRYDLVIIAGDHIDLSSAVDGRAQILVISKYLDMLREKTRIITCSGNHDLDGRDMHGEKTAKWLEDLNATGIPADDSTLEIDDILFSVCRWWDGPLAQARLAEQLARDKAAVRGKWFWVHHAPSFDSPTSWSGSRSLGDKTVQEWINTYQPDMVFSGHIHQSPFTRAGSWVDRIGKTWVFNVGQYAGVPPAHIAINTDLNEAVWLSMAGIQTVKLDGEVKHPVHAQQRPPEWMTL